MEQGNKNGKLAGLILAIVAIVVIVALFGSLCTCFCTVGACFKPDGCANDLLPDIDEPVVFDTPAATPTEAPVTPEPTEPSGAVSPLDWDGQQSAEVVNPAAWVREKKVQLKNDGTDTVTVLVLMNGSDLESEYQEATEDLREMVRAEKSDRVNILVETVGTRKWDPYFGISSRRAERYRVTNKGLTLVDDSLGQLDTTDPSTLSDFIRWGEQNFPADRYILLLWDHGGGPVYGFGYDELQPYTAALTIDEMQLALRDGGVYFDLIGMDCCLMSSLEVCCALYDYCDYTLLSEDFEPSCGWSHSEWLTALAKDPAIPTQALALIDEAYVALLYPAWAEFAYENEATLLAANYSQLRQSTGRAHPRTVGAWTNGNDATLDDYCITDILSLAENIPSGASDALRAALNQAIAYFGATKDETTLSGLSVTLPYGDADLYSELRRVFLNAGIDADYVAWLRKFVSVETETGFFDFGGWSGWGDYSGGYDWGDWFDLFGGSNGWDDWTAGGFTLEDIFGRLLGE